MFKATEEKQTISPKPIFRKDLLGHALEKTQRRKCRFEGSLNYNNNIYLYQVLELF